MIWSRRQVLVAGALAGASAAGVLRAHAALAQDQGAKSARIALENLHTGEHLEIEYARDQHYDPAALAQLELLLRDFRTNERHAIDPRLLDYLTELAARLGRAPAFSVISGYRSPQTNEKLHEKSSGVAQHSLHVQGRAMDVRLAGVDCATLAAKAMELKRGGVGYYRASDFVHLDTGAFRTWRG